MADNANKAVEVLAQHSKARRRKYSDVWFCEGCQRTLIRPDQLSTRDIFERQKQVDIALARHQVHMLNKSGLLNE